jgi:beta-lactam-binding protein with PASTA domain
VAQDTRADRRIARLVGGRYEITGLIASGGMGEVFEARDRVLDRVVALKVLRPGLGADPAFVERFRREATAAARLSHPGIVRIYDWGRDEDGSAYMAMELVEGQNLRQVLAAAGRLRPEVAARVAEQVAAALEHARRAGLVHRDVKPENILLSPDGSVKVADFGLARTLASSRATQAGVVLGTPHYLAPEQVEGREADHRADVYALGVVLYEMLTGETPFRGDAPAAIAYQRLERDVPAPSARVPGVPPALDDVVRRATARDPARRFATAGEMAEALRVAVDRTDTGELGALVHPTTAIPVAARETVALPGRRRARLTRRGVVAVVALLALVGAAIPVLVGTLRRLPVPDVAGMPKAAAQERLARAGFRVTTDVENNAQVPEGSVIRTVPPAGTALRRGSTVVIVISQGPVKVRVPNVRGRPFDEASRALEGLGLVVKRVDAFSQTVPKDVVIDQDKDPDVLVAQGTTVTLTVSKGKERVAVPDVRGRTEAEATQALQAAGLAVAVQRADSDTVPAGSVISQTPEPGTRVDKGSEVTIVVSNGPPRVQVPDVLCMTRRQAADTLAAAGLRVRFEGSFARVVDQDPRPGAVVPRGSTVVAYTAPGTSCR